MGKSREKNTILKLRIRLYNVYCNIINECKNKLPDKLLQVALNILKIGSRLLS